MNGMVCFAVLFLDCKGVKNENEIYCSVYVVGGICVFFVKYVRGT